MHDDEERPYHHGRLRTALLAAAERTLREQGADQLSLRELAREVGVSHAAPRRHFADRSALLEALAVAGFGRLDAQLRTAAGDAGSGFEARLRATVGAYVRFATEDAALMELMFARKHRDGSDEVIAAAVPAFTLLYDVIAHGQDAGALAAGDPERIGIVLFATMQGIATLTTGDMLRPDLLEGIVDTAVDQFLRGAGPA